MKTKLTIILGLLSLIIVTSFCNFDNISNAQAIGDVQTNTQDIQTIGDEIFN